MIEVDYINRISPTLERFKWSRYGKVATFRCPFCGDSQKNTRKTRGFLYEHDSKWSFKCHNCSASHTFYNFLQELYQDLFTQYRLDTMKSKTNFNGWDIAPTKGSETAQKRATIDFLQQGNTSVASLPENHPASVYTRSRMIPKLDRITYTENFKEWVDDHFRNHDYTRLPEDQRILFELRDERGRLFGVNARSLDKDAFLRYITIKDDSHIKVYGMDRVNRTLPVFILEGPIDSLMIPNAVALVGGDVGEVANLFCDNNVYIALDNEPRSRDTISRMDKAIQTGCNVCFWDIPEQYKDVNDMVLNGYTRQEITKHILENSYKGAKAKLMLSKWRKV